MSMDSATLTALKDSIRGWEEKRDAAHPGLVSLGPSYCALCKQFYDDNCSRCPVAKKVGFHSCLLTPYGAACRAFFDWREQPDNSSRHRVWVARAQEEVDFLKSLMPEGETV